MTVFLIIKEFKGNLTTPKHNDLRALRVETMRYTRISIHPQKKAKPTMFESLKDLKKFVEEKGMKEVGYAEIKREGNLEFVTIKPLKYTFE